MIVVGVRCFGVVDESHALLLESHVSKVYLKAFASAVAVA
jgi:hypothetical protein